MQKDKIENWVQKAVNRNFFLSRSFSISISFRRTLAFYLVSSRFAKIFNIFTEI